MNKPSTTPLLHYEERGNGPVVVLLHGFMASGRYWRLVADKLSRDHRVITLDLLGFGKSPKPLRSRYDYEDQLASIDATLDELGIHGDFTLMGHSMGSLLSLRYASTRPERVSKLVLTNMPIFLNYREARNGIMRSNIFYYIGLRAATHHAIWALFRAVVSLRMLPMKTGECARARRDYMFQSTAASRLRSLRNVIYSARIQADLALLKTRTVILSGLQDNKLYIQNLEQIKPSSNTTVINVPGGHHLPLVNAGLIAELAV